MRRDLLEQLDPLADNRRLHNGETCSVAARMRQALDETAPDRIGNDHKNDGDGMRFLQHRRGWGCVLRKNEVGLRRDEFPCGLSPRPRVIECPPARLDLEIAALRPPKLVESFLECSQVSLKFRVALRMRHQHADAPHPVRLLGARRKRPHCRRGADQREEFPAFYPRGHSITWSARRRNDSGIDSPMALAAVRLTTKSNFVGRITGRSADFSPLRMRPAYAPI